MTDNISIEFEEFFMEDEVIPESQKIALELSSQNLPVYYKYRYTFDKDTQDLSVQQSFSKLIIAWIKKHYLVGDKITAGIEHYTKGMLPAKPHLHIHFLSRSKADTIRKGLAYNWPENFIGRCQSCKAEVIVDEPKFWRYPLKQQSGDTRKYAVAVGFTKEEKQSMIDTGYACWKQSAEVLQSKLEKKEEKIAKDRLFIYLGKKQYKDIRTIYIEAYRYFVEYEPSFSYTSVNGYAEMYMLQNQILTYEEYFELKNPNFKNKNL